MVGKKPKLNKKLIKLYYKAVLNGLNKTVAAKKLRVNYATLMYWLKDGREFVENSNEYQEFTPLQQLCVELYLADCDANAQYIKQAMAIITDVAEGNDEEVTEKIVYNSEGEIVSRETTTKKAKKSFPAAAWKIERLERTYQLLAVQDDNDKQQGPTLLDLINAMNISLKPDATN